jgi:hypothetical protein
MFGGEGFILANFGLRSWVIIDWHWLITFLIAFCVWLVGSFFIHEIWFVEMN